MEWAQELEMQRECLCTRLKEWVKMLPSSLSYREVLFWDLSKTHRGFSRALAKPMEKAHGEKEERNP